MIDVVLGIGSFAILAVYILAMSLWFLSRRVRALEKIIEGGGK